MARAGVNEIRSTHEDDDSAHPIELLGLGVEDEEYACCWSFWHMLSWVVSLVLYTIEFFVTIWVAYTYATSNSMFVPFGVSLAYLSIPQIILVTLSLTWYYNLDRYHRKRKESDPHNLEFVEYRKKFTIGAIVCHVMLLGLIYRYSQLIYQVMIRKFNNVPFLRRDAGYLRLIHSLLVSAPLVILHLYVIATLYLQPCLDPAMITSCTPLEYPSLYAALGASLVTLLYSLLSFTTNDRFSGKGRRVIFPAHLAQTLWYLCVLSSRVFAIVLFTYTYQYYIFPFIGGHWIVMFLFLLAQRTTFCADFVRSDDSSLTVKRRWCLELPFNCIAATMLVFAFFGFRRGKTRFWALFYHLLTYAEIVTMSVLFYLETSKIPTLYVFALTSLTIALGLYPVGVLFMLAYYLFFHPRKTKKWYWIGVPRKRSHRETQSITSGGFRNQPAPPYGRLDISGPTLVAHNGFIPRSMLPSEVPSTPGDESRVIVDPREIIVESRKTSTFTEPREEELNWVSPTNQSNTSQATANETGTTAPGMIPSVSISPSSDAPSPIGPSDLDTDISSSVLHVQQGEFRGDTVIDTPLFGNTPDPNHQNRLKLDSAMDPSSGTLRSRTDTVDTGIDLGPDTPLTQDNEDPFTRNRENLALDIDLPQYSGGRNGFVSKNGHMETHYFPKQQRESLTPTLPAPTWSSRSPGKPPGLAHNSSGDSGDMYQTNLNNTGSSSHHVVPVAMSTPERTRRNTPRSPKGARAFTIAPVEEGKPQGLVRNRNSHPTSFASHTEPYYPPTPSKVLPPRSPKGARRMIVAQLEPIHKQGPEQEIRNQRLSNSYNLSRSPERRGVLTYQKQGTSAKTPDGRRRMANRPSLVQKSNSLNVPGKVRSPERQQVYRREAPGLQQKQYIQQQQENRSRWDKWAAEQEEKRRQISADTARNSYISTTSYTGSPQHRASLTHSHPSSKKHMSRNASTEFDHLEPVTDSVDASSYQGASVAPQGYPRMPQGARGNGPRIGWSPGRHSDRISLSPQRSIHSVPGISLGHRDTGAALSASSYIPTRAHTRSPRNSFKMSGHSDSFKKFYAPTSSTHQSCV